MKKTLSSLAGLALAATLCSPAAHAVSLVSVISNGNVVDTSFSTASQIAVDVGFVGTAPVLLNFLATADDIAAGSVSFNSIISQIGAGQTFDQITLGVTGGALFSVVGSASSLNNATPVSASTYGVFENLAIASAVSPTTEVYLGNPFDDGSVDWRIGFGTMKANKIFTLSLSTNAVTPVPEPSSLALALGGLGVLAWVAARRRSV